MIHEIYIFSVLVISIGVIVYYYLQENKHKQELEKINKIEQAFRKEQLELETLRAQTTPCPVGNFTNPRSCYIDSNYTCSWNDITKRCDIE